MSRITATRVKKSIPRGSSSLPFASNEFANRTEWYEACSRCARMRATKSWFIAVALLAGACGGSNKQAEGPAEHAGKEADEKAQEAQDKVKEEKDQVKEKADEAKEKADEAKDKADDEH